MIRIAILIIAAALMVSSPVVAQTSFGFELGFSFKESFRKDQALDNAFMLGVNFKKYLSKDFSLITGLGYRFYDATLAVLPQQNDLITFAKDAHPDDFFYITQGSYMRMHYATIPIGLEFKVTTFMRISYSWDNNILLGTNEDAAYYLEYGKKAFSPLMFSQTAAVSLHANGLGLSLAATFNPSIIRGDLHYTYDYVDAWRDELNHSVLLTLKLWGDTSYKKRKKI